MFVSFMVSVYYNMIIGWSFYYMFISMQEKLPYQSCATFDHITPGKDQRRIFIFSFGGVDKYLGGGGAAACFGRGLVATPGKAKEKV
jgi:hypothetical protein